MCRHAWLAAATGSVAGTPNTPNTCRSTSHHRVGIRPTSLTPRAVVIHLRVAQPPSSPNIFYPDNQIITKFHAAPVHPGRIDTGPIRPVFSGWVALRLCKNSGGGLRFAGAMPLSNGGDVKHRIGRWLASLRTFAHLHIRTLHIRPWHPGVRHGRTKSQDSDSR
jgi:hypothetical protein